MEFTVDRSIEILSRTPATLRNLLQGLSPDWVMRNYGQDTFSPFDVIGHLIHGEQTDWIPRARIILQHGETRAFEPFDRYAMYEASKGKSIDQLLDEFESLRRKSIEALSGMRLTQADLDRRGKHPDPSFAPVTLRQLLATWTVHDLHHIAQICKAMAFQYRHEVGPWKAYLGILPK